MDGLLGYFDGQEVKIVVADQFSLQSELEFTLILFHISCFPGLSTALIGKLKESNFEREILV